MIYMDTARMITRVQSIGTVLQGQIILTNEADL